MVETGYLDLALCDNLDTARRQPWRGIQIVTAITSNQLRTEQGSAQNA